MSAFQQQYKAKPIKFIDTRVGKNIRAVQCEESRKKRRADIMNGKRSISNGSGIVTQQDESQPTASQPESCVLQLQMCKKKELLKKKRPFLTGIVHHRLYSPISQTDNVTYKSMQYHKVRKPVAPATPPKRITRATEKRLQSKACMQGPAVVTKSLTPTGGKGQKNLKTQKSIAPNNYKFKPPAGLQDMKDETELNSINHETLNRIFDKIGNSLSAKYRTRSTSGSVDLDNKRFTPSNNGRLKSNLLLNIELSHRERTSSTVIKVSKTCKTVDLQLDNSISYINSDQTPMKCILKPSKTLTKKKHAPLNEVPVDEEMGTKLDLALAIIDSFDFDSIDEEVPINCAKRLNFDDSSSEEAEDDHDAEEHSGLRNSVSDSTSRSTCHRSRLRRERSRIENKQALPMTPYVRASSSRSESTEMNKRSKISEDHI